jgi:hypothetical protein
MLGLIWFFAGVLKLESWKACTRETMWALHGLFCIMANKNSQTNAGIAMTTEQASRAASFMIAHGLNFLVVGAPGVRVFYNG